MNYRKILILILTYEPPVCGPRMMQNLNQPKIFLGLK